MASYQSMRTCTLLYGFKVVVEGCLRGQFKDNVYVSEVYGYTYTNRT